MSISVIGTSTATAASAASITINKPAGTLTNHLVVVFVSSDTSALTQVQTGWTGTSRIGSSSLYYAVYYKRVTSTEPSSWTFTMNTGTVNTNITASAITLNGVASNTPDWTSVSSSTTAASGFSSSHTPVVSGGLNLYVLFGFAVRSSADSGATAVTVSMSAPSTATKLVDFAKAANSHAVFGYPALSGSTTPYTASFSASSFFDRFIPTFYEENTVPTASFTYAASLGGYQFTDTSTKAPTSWAWTFGDGTTSTAQNPYKGYTLPGTYTVSLVATNAVGASTASTQTITIAPVARSNTFEGGTSGTAVSTTNSGGTSGDAFDAVVATATFANGYNSPVGFSPSTTGGSLSWNHDGGNVAYRFYVMLTGYPSASAIATTSWTGGGSTTFSHRIFFSTAGKLSIQNSAGTQLGVATNACALNTWYRVEVNAVVGTTTANGSVTMSYYLGDSTTVVQTVTNTGINTGTIPHTSTAFGRQAGTWVAGSLPVFDDMALDTSKTTIGPYSAPYTPTGTIVASESWTGANGAAWPSQWTKRNGTTTIQSNSGRMTSASSVAYDSVRSDLTGMTAIADTDLFARFAASAPGITQFISFHIDSDTVYDTSSANTSGGWYPNNGYVAEIQYDPTPASSSVSLFYMISGTQTYITAANVTLEGTSSYRVRFQRSGTTLRAKVWPSSGPEPTAWSVTTTVSNIYTGKAGVTSANGNLAVTRSFTVNDLYVMGSAPTALPFKLWDGTTEQTLTLAGLWNGTTIVPLTYKVWNGTTEV